MKKTASVAIALALVTSFVSPAHAEVDPFPGVAHMAEIPGTRVSSPAGFTQAQWEASESYLAYLSTGCPLGSGNAVSVDTSQKIWSNYCVKTWQPQSTIDAWNDYYSQKAAAEASALAESVAWNTANPGKQKCFQWGPLTDPNGGTSAGGVCANPVYEAEASSQTVSRTTDREETDVFETTQTNNRVIAFLSSIDALPTITKKVKVSLPKISKGKKLGLTTKLLSRSPEVCTVTKSTVRFLSSGECKVGILIRDKSGNRVSSTVTISRT